jgi:hypothetical protein
MAIVHLEEDLARTGATPRNAPPGARAGHRRSRAKSQAMWILAATLLGATGLIAFQFLVTLVTLD